MSRRGLNLSNKNQHLIDDEELEAIKEVLESGEFYRYQLKPGPCELFEKEAAAYFGVKNSLTITSGTNAIIIALTALGIGEGDEVIIPAYTFYATASAVLNVGAIPVVVNIDNSLMISPIEIKNAITDKTKAIIPVHMDGLQSPMEEILEIASSHNIHVVEDAAQCFGGSIKGKKLGSFGVFGCFSFNRGKTITCGEGGLVICDDETLAEKSLCLSDQAVPFNPINKDKFTKITPFVGMSMRVSEISGAMLRVQLKKIDKILEEHKVRKNLLVETLKSNSFYGSAFDLVEAHDPDGQTYSTYHLQFKDPEKALLVSKKLMAEKIVVIPLTMKVAHSVWKWNQYLKKGRFYSTNRDPYENTDKKYPFLKIDFIPTLEILMRTISGEMDITMSLEEVKSHGESISKAISEVLS